MVENKIQIQSIQVGAQILGVQILGLEWILIDTMGPQILNCKPWANSIETRSPEFQTMVWAPSEFLLILEGPEF